MPNRVTIWILPAAAILTLMHLSDELWSRWDAGGQVTSNVVASLMIAPFAIVLVAFAMELRRMPWASPLTFLVGLFFGYSAQGHFVNTAGMDGFRWTVVVLQMAAALTIVLTSIAQFLVDKPWKGTRTAAG